MLPGMNGGRLASSSLQPLYAARALASRQKPQLVPIENMGFLPIPFFKPSLSLSCFAPSTPPFRTLATSSLSSSLCSPCETRQR